MSSHATKHPLSPTNSDACTTIEPTRKRTRTETESSSASTKAPATDVSVRQSKLTDFFVKAPSKASSIACDKDSGTAIETKEVHKPVAVATNVGNAAVVANNVVDVPAILRSMQTEKHLEVHPRIGSTWFASILQPEFQKPYYSTLSNHLSAERKQFKIFPPPELIWTWTSYFDCSDTKVVIIGQDPYHGAGQAHGLCFSVPPNVAVPASLRNIYEELEQDINGFKRPKHGCLRGWARQGVLLLNAVLTVRAGQANSHQKKMGWEHVTDAVVDWLNKHGDHVVFMLWGQYAQAKCAKVDSKRHLVLKAAHPSPLAGGKFKNCKHFSQANKWLSDKGKKPIDWSDLTEM